MTDARVAKRYAKALFNIAQRQDILQSVEDDLTSVEAVVNAAWSPKPQGAIVTVTRQCFCADAPETATDCSVNCADGDYPRMYTKITGSMSYTGFGGDTSTLNASQKVRTR